MQKTLIISLALLPGSARAHIGDHTHIELTGLLTHLSEPDHLIIIGVAVIAGLFAVRRYRNSRAFFAVKKGNQNEPR
jgi:hydrogenase/urease accessory protein HupE